MKLSVIIPCYKFKDYIVECIESIASQITNFEFEILVRDDFSQDGTYEMLADKYKNHNLVKILPGEINLGPAGNLMHLLKQAKGIYTAILDGDDFLVDNSYYQRAVDFLDNNKEFSIVSAGYRVCYGQEIVPKGAWLNSTKKIVVLEDLLENNFISLGRVFRKIDLSKVIFDGIHYPDWLINFELLKNGSCLCEDQSCSVVYRIHDQGMFSKTSEEEKAKKISDMKQILQKKYDLHNQKNQEDVIVHIHLFLTNNNCENIAYDNIKTIKNQGFKILITSPKVLPLRFYEIIDIFYHDKENILLKEEYLDVSPTYQWTLTDNFILNLASRDQQKHGLAVLRSMIKGCQLASMNGIKYILRIEFDDILGKDSLQNSKTILKEVKENGNDFYLIRNIYTDSIDVSVHFMIYDCSKFLSIFDAVRDEKSYNVELCNLGIPKKHIIIEEFIYLMIEKNKTEKNAPVKYVYHSYIESKFADSRFNIIQTCSAAIDGVLSDAAYGFVDGVAEKKLYFATKNLFSEKIINVIFDVLKKDGSECQIKLSSGGINCWAYNCVDWVSEIEEIKIKNEDKSYHKEYKILSFGDGFNLVNKKNDEPCLSHIKFNNKI